MSENGAPGHRALQELDTILAKRPKKDGHDFSAATQDLCRFRDEMIRIQNGPDASEASRNKLERLNAILSVVLGGHFPLGHIPWDELQKARDWLSDLVEFER